MVSRYAADFCTLAIQTTLSSSALHTTFYEWLAPHLKGGPFTHQTPPLILIIDEQSEDLSFLPTHLSSYYPLSPLAYLSLSPYLMDITEDSSVGSGLQ